MSNEITAYFKGRAGVSESLYQYDYGMVLNLDGIELPSSFECYFDTTGSDEAIPAIGTDSRVAIPNDCLSRPGDVTLHIPLHSGVNDSQVEYVVKFRVIGRARPVDGGTPEQQTAIEQALALLQNPITNIEQIVNEALAFTGDTFDEMQEQLDADQAAYESSMNNRATEFESGINNRQSTFESGISTRQTTVETQFNNLATNLTPNSKEVLWTGQTLDGTMTLSKAISNFDFIDIEYEQSSQDSTDYKTITKRIPAVAGTYSINDFAMDYENGLLDFFEQKITLSNTSLTAAQNYNVTAVGGSDAWIKQRGTYQFWIVRIVGIKMGSASPAELTDIRVGADGKTYSSAGVAVRKQFANAKGDAKNWAKFDGVTVEGNLYPTITERGHYGYWYSPNSGQIEPLSGSVYEGFDYFKMPVDENSMYYFNEPARWIFSIDANGDVVNYNNEGTLILNTGNGAVEICATYYKNSPITRIRKNDLLDDSASIFLLPDSVVSNISLGELSGKITPDMIEGFEYGNLLKGMRLYAENKYVFTVEVGVVPTISDNNNISTFDLDAENTLYTFSDTVRFLTAVDENGLSLSASLQYPTRFDNTVLGAKKLYFSIENSIIDSIIISKGGFVDENDTYPDWLLNMPIPEQSITAERVKGFEWGNLRNVLVKTNEDSYNYASAMGMVPEIVPNANLDVYELLAESVNYVFSDQVRFLTAVDEEGKSIAVSTAYATGYDNSNGAAYKLQLSINKTMYPTIIISKGNIITTNNIYPDWLEQLRQSSHDTDIVGSYFDRYVGNYSGQIRLNAISSSVSSNVEYAFDADIADWSSDSVISFILYNGTSSLEAERFDVSDTQVTLKDYNYGNPTTFSVAHGLTIENNIQLHIKQTYGGVFTVELTSNGMTYSHEFATAKQFITQPSILATDVTPTGCCFSWLCRNIEAETWCFGDSYFGATNNQRWVYYLVQSGYYEGKLFDNYPGGNSSALFTSLQYLLNYGKPKRIFWALGMNDGSDTDNTPSSSWSAVINSLISICESRNIELILATIPTVPSINHEAKNAFVRNSGYQYVDFAKAVGASSSGVWFSGMLSGDNVHPTAKGAVTLYNRVLSDFQQITFK